MTAVPVHDAPPYCTTCSGDSIAGAVSLRHFTVEPMKKKRKEDIIYIYSGDRKGRKMRKGKKDRKEKAKAVLSSISPRELAPM